MPVAYGLYSVVKLSLRNLNNYNYLIEKNNYLTEKKNYLYEFLCKSATEFFRFRGTFLFFAVGFYKKPLPFSFYFVILQRIMNYYEA